MSTEFQQAIDINAPPEKIWPIMVDVERWHEWTASITEIKLLDPGPIGVGTRARVRQPKLPTAIWQVTQFVPGTGFVWENHALGTHSAGEHWIVPSDNGPTAVRLVLRQNGLIAKLLSPLTSGLIRRYINMEAQGLKKICEA